MNSDVLMLFKRTISVLWVGRQAMANENNVKLKILVLNTLFSGFLRRVMILPKPFKFTTGTHTVGSVKWSHVQLIEDDRY